MHGLRREFRGGGWIQRVSDGDRFVDVMGFQFGLNSAVAAMVAKDKAAAAEYLGKEAIPVVGTELVLLPNRLEWLDEDDTPHSALSRALARTGLPAVVKPNEGSSGTGVKMVTSEDEAWEATRAILEERESVAVQALCDLVVEERWVLLGDEPVVWYRKVSVPDGAVMATFNLTLGATVSHWGAEHGDPAHLAIARRARQAIGLTFCAVYLVTTRTGEVLVLEVNSGVSFEHLIEAEPDAEPAAYAAYEAAVLVGLGRRDLDGTSA